MKRWVESHQVLAALLAAALFFAAWEVYPALIVLFVGYLLGAALRPVIRFLNAYLPRILAILLTYLLLFVVLAGIIAGIALPLSSQAGQFSAQFLHEIQPGQPLFFLQSLGLNSQSFLSFMTHNAQGLATSTLAILTSAIASIVISIYLLYDWRGIHASLEEGGSFSKRMAKAFAEAELALGGWVHGQLLLSATVGLLVFITMFLSHVPFSPVLGVLAAITEFIPYVGPILAAVPAVLFGLNTSLESALIIALIYLAIHQLENHLLVPIIMRHSVNIHPVIVIVVMFAGFELLGIAGVILAVPFTAFARIIIPALWYD